MHTDADNRLAAFCLFSSGAFAGGNLFLGRSMGPCRLSLGPQDDLAMFFGQWVFFLRTIMPLFLMSLCGLVRSARRSADHPCLRAIRRRALQCWIATVLSTLFFHMPLNLRLGAATFSPEEAAASGSTV